LARRGNPKGIQTRKNRLTLRGAVEVWNCESSNYIEAIAHLAVAFGCLGIKTGAVGGERIAKLNELIRIEEELQAGA